MIVSESGGYGGRRYCDRNSYSTLHFIVMDCSAVSAVTLGLSIDCMMAGSATYVPLLTTRARYLIGCGSSSLQDTKPQFLRFHVDWV